MAVNRYATQAGRTYQRDVMRYLRDDKGLDAENLVLAGAEDEGDILLRLYSDDDNRRYQPVVIEAKREKGYNLASWVTQAQKERFNYARHRGLEPVDVGFVVVSKRRNAAIGQSYVITTLDEWLVQMR